MALIRSINLNHDILFTIDNIASNLEKRKDGIYYSKSDTSVSYPEDGNDICMQIEDNSFWFEHRNNVIATAVKKLSPEETFFDIGGGNGFVAKNLQDSGISCVLVEPGRTGAVNAKKRNVQTVICSTLEDAAFNENSFGAVGMFDVVEHIEDDQKFLSDIYRYVQKDKHVYITVPAYQNLWSNEDVDAGHFRRYTTLDLNTKLKAAGFEIVYSSYIFSILPLPVFFFRSLPSKLGFNKNSSDLQKHKNEHKKSDGILTKLLNLIWRFELRRVEKFMPIPIGGSCFVIAKKT